MIRLHEALDLARDKSASSGAAKPAQEPPIVIPWEFGRDPEKLPVEPAAERAPEPVVEPVPEPEVEAAPRRYGWGVLVAALAAVVALAGYAVWMSSASATQDLRLSGIVAANQVVVASNLPGRIDRLTVDEGARVEAGDLLVQMDRAELEAERQHHVGLIQQLNAKLTQARKIVAVEGARGEGQIAAAGAGLQASRSQRDEALATAEHLRSEKVRAELLFEKGIVSRQMADQAAADLRVAEARLAALEDGIARAQADEQLARANAQNAEVALHDIEQIQAQITQAEAQLEQLAARIAQGDIRAPRSGTVSLVVSRQGEVIRAGDPIATIIDLDDVWVRAELEESYMNQIKVGQTLDVHLASGRTLKGTVTMIEPEAQFATQRDVSRTKRDIRTFGVKVSLPNKDRLVHVGMTAFVTVPSGIVAAAP